MVPYRDFDNNSGVAAYEIGPDYIIVEFKERSKSGYKFYQYTYGSAGMWNIEEMKKLATKNDGLHAFINKEVRDRVYKKW